MDEYYRFLENEADFKWFYDHCIPDLREDQVFFISLSARNKQLSAEEREIYDLGRTEMFGKQVIRHDDYETIKSHILRYESKTGSYLARSRKPAPQKCMIVYWNINPSSARKVMAETLNMLGALNGEMIDAALKNSRPGTDSAFHKMKKFSDSVISLYARCPSEKIWLDIDVDVSRDCLASGIEDVHAFLSGRLGRGNFVEIETKGGMHVLVKTSAVKFNPQEICDGIRSRLEQKMEAGNEIVINRNQMIPMPGCSQAGWTVKILNRDDFDGGNTVKRGKTPEFSR